MTRSVIHPRSPRRGTILIVVLTVMSILMALAATMLRGTQLTRRHVRSELHLRQIDQLLHAATAMAAEKLATGSPFSESRTIARDEIVGRHDASLTVTTEPDAKGGWRIEAVAEYPLGAAHPIRRRRLEIVPAADTLPSPPAVTPRQPTPEEPS